MLSDPALPLELVCMASSTDCRILPLPFLKALQFWVIFIQEDFDRVLSCSCLQVRKDSPKMWI